jgi:hypothetical protein
MIVMARSEIIVMAIGLNRYAVCDDRAFGAGPEAVCRSHRCLPFLPA